MWTIASAFVFFALPLKGLASEIGQDASDELVHTEPVKLDDDSDTASEFLLAGGVHPLKTSRSDAEDFTRELRLISHSSYQTSSPRNRVLPTGLLFRSYIAGPHEPRISSAGLYDLSAEETVWDATLGGRVGLFRQDNPTRFDLDAWQIDVEGAAIVRLDAQDKQDLESGDYRFGLLWTGKRENLAFKFGYFHMSSHVGDEFLIKNPTFNRINYVRESIIFGTSLQASRECRLYGELAWGAIATGGAEPWQFQLGTEFSPIARTATRGAPFAAFNMQMREEVDFAPGMSFLTGWQWKSPENGSAIRLGLQYFNGPSNQYQFFEEYQNQLGFGVWYDF